MSRLTYRVFWHIRLGEGGEGQVFLAQSSNGKYCAIKFARSYPLLRDRTSMVREICRMIRASGERVVELLDFNIESEIPYVVVEFADLGTLRDLMNSHAKRRCVYYPMDALLLARSILLAVEQVHLRGLVHRDVKPENLLLFSTGNVFMKLADFGSGRTLSRPYPLQTRAFIGTERYASPEQRNCWAVDQRADLYSVGVILYELLMGQVPNSHWKYWTAPSKRYRNIPPSIDALLRLLLADNSAERIPSARSALIMVQGQIDMLLTKERALACCKIPA